MTSVEGRATTSMTKNQGHAHIGTWLRTNRLRKGMTQAEVATLLGIEPKTVQRWEQDRQLPRPYLRPKLAEIFGSFPEELKRGMEEQPLQRDLLSTATSPAVASPSPRVPMQKDETTTGGSLSDVSAFRPHQTTTTIRINSQIGNQERQNRERMLHHLRRSYQDLLVQSLQGITPIELNLSTLPSAVQHTTNHALRIILQAEHTLSQSRSIIQIYEDAGQELLILGKPGAGKSTLLLYLALHLVSQAERDESALLPVILPLSSWSVKQGSLAEWLPEHIAQIYNVPHCICQKWVRQEQILPLLDGLDEIKETMRLACIIAINAYRSAHFSPLVICSRTVEYKRAARKKRLKLRNAVLVRPLTHQQVDTTLEQAGEQLEPLRMTLQQHPDWQQLGRTPLMLHVLILTYQETTVQLGSLTETPLEKQIWTAYVQRMVEQKGDAKCYPLKQTCVWLRWLAQHMQEHNQAVFYLEYLQSDWLSTRQQHTYTELASVGPALLIGALISILVHLFFFSVTPDLSSFLQYSILGGLLGVLWQEATTTRVHQDTYRPIWKERFAISAGVVLLYGGSFAYYLWNPMHYTLHQWLLDGLSSGVGIGLGSFLLHALLVRPSHYHSSSQNSTPWRWNSVFRFFQALQGPRALLVTVVLGLSILLGNELSHGFGYGLNDVFSVMQQYGFQTTLRSGVSMVFSYGLSYGLSYVLISLTLGTQTESISLAERLRWTRKSLRRSLFNIRHLGVTILLVFTIAFFSVLSALFSYGSSYNLLDGISNGLTFGLSLGLSLGLSYWFFFGLFRGVSQEQLEDKDRRKVNQGIADSQTNGWKMGLIGGGTIGFLGLLGYGLSYGLSYLFSWRQFGGLRNEIANGLANGWGNALWMSIFGFFLIYLLVGGLAVFKHQIIRLQLACSHTFPRSAQPFLDDATDRGFLQRAGGGYRFIHRLLLDHFANSAFQQERREV